MLLPLNEPTTSPALQLITGIAGWLLDYVANWSGPTIDKQDFHTSLKQAGLWYLIGSRSAIAKHIPTLLRLSKDERKLLRNAFYNDIRFYDCLDSQDYAFCFSSLPDNIQEIGRAFLRLFYERLAGDGFHDEPGKRRTFTVTRTDVEDGYRAANEEMKLICPACLGHLEQPAEKISVKNVITKKSLVDCEHFFPKSLYPPLVVHPNNLVLVCKVCNYYHNNESPLHLNPLAALEAGALRKTFVPYKRSGLSAKGSKQQEPDEVKLVFDMVNPKKQFVTLVGNSKGPFSRERTENFDRVYGLSKRWSDLVPDIYGELRDSVLNNLGFREEALTRQNIERQLQILLKTYNERRCRSDGAYLRTQCIEWIQQNGMEPMVRELTS